MMKKLLLIFFLLHLLNPSGTDIEMDGKRITIIRDNQTTVIELVEMEDGTEKFIIEHSIETFIGEGVPPIERHPTTPE